MKRSEIKSFLDEKQVETLDEAARLADDYALTHKVSFVNKTKPTFSHSNSKVTSSNDYSLQSKSSAPKQRLFHDTKD